MIVKPVQGLDSPYLNLSKLGPILTSQCGRHLAKFSETFNRINGELRPCTGKRFSLFCPSFLC